MKMGSAKNSKEAHNLMISQGTPRALSGNCRRAPPRSIRLARKAMKLMKSLVLRFLDLLDCSSARISNKMLIKRLKIIGGDNSRRARAVYLGFSRDYELGYKF